LRAYYGDDLFFAKEGTIDTFLADRPAYILRRGDNVAIGASLGTSQFFSRVVSEKVGRIQV